MSTPQSLPNAALLEKLLLGQLPPAETDVLCAQLQDSEQFVALAQSLVASDTLIEALHAQTTRPTPRPDARLEGLMARLSKLRPDLSAVADDRTTAETPAGAAAPITFLSPARQPDEMGRLGAYRVLKVLGQGGMGVVFLAEDMRLGRRVALKTMRPEAAQMANAKQRFLREARGAAAIEHDHIIPIFQVGEENGVPFLAMPFLRGEPLDERLKRTQGAPLPLREIVRIGREVAEGLAAAHEQGLIHRDIKPANVWLEGERGRVKVLDFGLARAVGEDTNLTQSGAIVGTPAYMAPEQARGEAVDARCDLFSLGSLLYQMSTGQRPFNGPDAMSILMSLALDQPAPPRQRNAELPTELSDLITRLLAKKPEDRPASARAVADALAAIERGILDDITVSVGRKPIPAAAPMRTRRRLTVAVAATLLLVGGLMAVVVIIRNKKGEEVARVTLPDGGSVEVQLDDKAKPPEKEKKQAAAIPADPLPKIEPGTPLGPLALVTNPAPLSGVRSWTIETRTPRSGIDAVAYRPDGRLVATAGEDGVIRLREPQSGRLLRILAGHANRIARLAWSPDGSTLASGSWDGTVRLWDAENGRHLRKFSFGFMVDSLFWFPDGRTLAASRDNITHTWDVVRGELVRNQTWPNGAMPLALSPDGKHFAGRAGAKVRIWECETGREVRTLPEPIEGALHLAWSPDGRRMASTGGDHTVRLWELETAKELWSRKQPEAQYVRMAWSPDGKTLAVDRHPSVIEFIRAGDGKVLTWFQGVGFVSEMAWSSDSGQFAVGTLEGNLWLMKIAKTLPNIIPPTVPGPPRGSSLTSLAWSPDSKQLASATYGTGVRVVNPTTGETLGALADAGQVIAWAPSKWLTAAGPGSQVTLWQPGGGRRILPAHKSGGVRSLAWSPDGKTLADSSSEQALRLWEDATRQLKREWNTGGYVNDLAWSPDGQLLAAGIGAGPQLQVKLWRTDTGQELRTSSGFNGVAWSPVGETLAMFAGNQRNVQLVDAKTGELGLKLPTNEVYGAAWSPDGKRLAIAFPGEADKNGVWHIPLWDVATGEEVRRLERVCLSTFASLAWSPDGKRIAACAGQTVQLWDAASGKSEGVIFPNPHFHGLTIRPDGHYRGNFKVAEEIVIVVQKEDGNTETLPPAEFAQKYKWKNEW
jgi:WD40 repeat protein/serine/threonine protein kinase